MHCYYITTTCITFSNVHTKWFGLPFFVTARILLVDSDSFLPDPDMVDSLTEAVSNFLSVACNLGGSSRMSLFGIMTFSSYPEVIINADSWQCDINILICWYVNVFRVFFLKWAIGELYLAL